MNFDKVLERSRKFKKELAASYEVPETSIIWIGNNNFIVVKEGKEIRI